MRETVSEIEYASAEDDADEVPEDQRCAWPGCTRRRAPGRTGGSGRQKEYCLKANRPEDGGGPAHNARNRWAWRQKDRGETAGRSVLPAADLAGEAGAGAEQERRSVRSEMPLTAAKRRAGDLLEQARRQHAAALAAFTAERDLYARVAAQFEVLADPAALDLELTAAGVRAGRDVAAAAEDAAGAQRAQRAAETERDDALRRAAEADAAAEQFAADTEAAEAAAREAERILDERTAEFDAARGELALRTREAEEKAEAAEERASAAKTAADQAVAGARAEAERAVASARAQAEEAITRAVRRADDATAGAREQVTRIRADASEQVKAAAEETRQARRRADEAAERARREIAAAREEAGQARAEAGHARRDAQAEREQAHAKILAAETAAATANARAAAIEEQIARLRDERAAEIARLESAHQAALRAGRARPAGRDQGSTLGTHDE